MDQGDDDGGLYDAVVIGSGIGGLVTAALLAQAGQRVLVCESHSIPGGAAHSFERQGFCFDSGPSFYCGLGDGASLNPLTQVLGQLGESLETVAYDPLGHYHLAHPERADETLVFPVYGNLDRYRQALAHITPAGAKEFSRFEQKMLGLYRVLKDIPVLEIRPDIVGMARLLWRHPLGLAKLLGQLPRLEQSVAQVMAGTVFDAWVCRLVDLECFLLSGLGAAGTIAPEVAFMLGERNRTVIDYPRGGSGAIVAALVRGLHRFGGQLQLQAHVSQILLEKGRAVGVQLRKGQCIRARRVISNASCWDTAQLLATELGPRQAVWRSRTLTTPAVESFMHLHLGIRAEGLEGLTGHHVVVHRADQPVTTPGNTCMISIPSVWDPALAPAGHHVVHVYTLESFEGWQRDEDYARKKRAQAETLYRALEQVIPDVRQRIVLEIIGSPLTHAGYLRRYRGTYGPAIAAGQGRFPGPQTAIANLYCVGEGTMPGIGVPAVAASGIFCANMLKG